MVRGTQVCDIGALDSLLDARVLGVLVVRAFVERTTREEEREASLVLLDAFNQACARVDRVVCNRFDGFWVRRVLDRPTTWSRTIVECCWISRDRRDLVWCIARDLGDDR